MLLMKSSKTILLFYLYFTNLIMCLMNFKKIRGYTRKSQNLGKKMARNDCKMAKRKSCPFHFESESNRVLIFQPIPFSIWQKNLNSICQGGRIQGLGLREIRSRACPILKIYYNQCIIRIGFLYVATLWPKSGQYFCDYKKSVKITLSHFCKQKTQSIQNGLC